jgi:hypothetical protein
MLLSQQISQQCFPAGLSTVTSSEFSYKTKNVTFIPGEPVFTQVVLFLQESGYKITLISLLAVYSPVYLRRYWFYLCSKFLLNPIPVTNREKNYVIAGKKERKDNICNSPQNAYKLKRSS